MEAEERAHWLGFGDWLRDQRTARGLKKTEVAKGAGVSLSTWNTIEAGGRNWRGQWVLPSPSDATLLGIADALDLDRQAVWQRAGRKGLAPDRPLPQGDAALSGKMARLSREDRTYIEGLVDRLLGEEG